MILVIFLLLGILGGVAQSPENLGTVTGQVTCGESKRPCRLASILLQAVGIDKNQVRTNTYASASDLDGSFTIPQVTPGRYIVIGELEGYASPFSRFSRSEIESPTPEIIAALEESNPVITVQPRQTTTCVLLLKRASAISGTILYDDGSPAIGLQVKLWKRSATSLWVPAINNSQAMFGTLGFGLTATDDYGRYRIAGLGPGDFIIQASLPSFKFAASSLSGKPQLNIIDAQGSALSVFSGDGFSLRTAKSVALGQGDSITDENMLINLADLHSYCGSLIEGGGYLHDVSGRIAIRDSLDGSVVREAAVEKNGTWCFKYLPSGSYFLEVSVESNVNFEGRKIRRALSVQSDVADATIDLNLLPSGDKN